MCAFVFVCVCMCVVCCVSCVCVHVSDVHTYAILTQLSGHVKLRAFRKVVTRVLAWSQRYMRERTVSLGTTGV